MNYRYFSLVIKVFNLAHAGVQTISLIKRDHLIICDFNVGSSIFVMTIFVGHDAIQVIIASRELNYN
jgi:hypothetical protein